SLFFALIQAEGNLPEVQATLDAWEYDPKNFNGKRDGLVALDVSKERYADNAKEALQTWLPRVHEYYLRAIKVSESMELMPLLAEWIKEFGASDEGSSGSGGSSAGAGDAGMEDLQLGAQLQANPELLEAFENDSVPLGNPENDKPAGNSFTEGDPADAKDAPISIEGGVLEAHPYASIDDSRVAIVVNKFKKFFESKLRKVSSMTPGARISARH